MRLLIEIISIVLGLLVVLLIASLSAWAYPRGKADIWLVAYICMAVSVLLGAGQLRRAYRADRDVLRRHKRLSDDD